MARLVGIWKARLASLLPRRDALLRRQSECSADGDASAEVLADLERFQGEYVFTAMACANALWGCVMTPHQVGGARAGRGWGGTRAGGRGVRGPRPGWREPCACALVCLRFGAGVGRALAVFPFSGVCTGRCGGDGREQGKAPPSLHANTPPPRTPTDRKSVV